MKNASTTHPNDMRSADSLIDQVLLVQTARSAELNISLLSETHEHDRRDHNCFCTRSSKDRASRMGLTKSTGTLIIYFSTPTGERIDQKKCLLLVSLYDYDFITFNETPTPPFWSVPTERRGVIGCPQILL
ncbi:unnamed protein product [Amoebophrya sp. A25]|nr:unnamed protein product [Amoebophrya sp. A25]|eukprot:GSA25T00009868001.1